MKLEIESKRELKLNLICRTCLVEADNLAPLFESRLVDEFFECFALNIVEDPRLPRSVCTGCRLKIIESLDFKRLCIESELNLQSILELEEQKVPEEIVVQIVKDEPKDEVLIQEFYLCDCCNSHFATKKCLKEHLSVSCIKEQAKKHKDTDPLNFTCQQCNITYNSKKALKIHQRKTHGPKEERKEARRTPKSAKFACFQCSNEFSTEKMLLRHNCLEKHFECPTCHCSYTSEKSMKRHQQTHQENIVFTCKMCGREFKRKDKLTAHLKIHSGTRLYVCECGKKFHQRGTLKEHLRVHSGERPYICDMCGKSFTLASNLKQHQMRHMQVKPFECKHCSKRFVSKGELECHLRVHTLDKPYVCECGASFSMPHSLTKHRRKHTGEKPYCCEFCPMRFAALGTLVNHRRTHTGEKPYICQFCNRGFAQQNDKKKHERIHTGERPFPCLISSCPMRFTKSSTRKQHMKTHEKSNLSHQTIIVQEVQIVQEVVSVS